MLRIFAAAGRPAPAQRSAASTYLVLGARYLRPLCRAIAPHGKSNTGGGGQQITCTQVQEQRGNVRWKSDKQVREGGNPVSGYLLLLLMLRPRESSLHSNTAPRPLQFTVHLPATPSRSRGCFAQYVPRL